MKKMAKATKIDLEVKKPYGNEHYEVGKFKGASDAIISANALGKAAPSNYEYSVKATNKYSKGGHVSKGEMVWKKLSSSEKIKFLHENFTPEITPRSQETLVGKPYNFLPKNVKIKMEAKYANSENYANGGGLADVPESFPSTDAMSYKTGGATKKTFAILYPQIVNAIMLNYGISKDKAESIVDSNETYLTDLIEYYEETNPSHLSNIIMDTDEGNYAQGGSTKGFEYSIGGL